MLLYQGAGTYIVEAAAGGTYKLDKVELDTSTSGVTDDYKLTAATDDTITVASSETALVTAIQTFLGGTPTSVGTLGAASSVGTYTAVPVNLIKDVDFSFTDTPDLMEFQPMKLHF